MTSGQFCSTQSLSLYMLSLHVLSLHIKLCIFQLLAFKLDEMSKEVPPVIPRKSDSVKVCTR